VRKTPGIPCALLSEGYYLARLGQIVPREYVVTSSQLSCAGVTGASGIPEASPLITAVSGILDRPIEPGDDIA
jgi:hypothetical protein